MNEAKLSAAQRAYDTRMPDEEGDMLDAWVGHVMGCRDELADVLEEHYTRPIAEFVALKLSLDYSAITYEDVRAIVKIAEAEVMELVYDHCRKEVDEPTSAQMDACDDREAGR